ncbi:MAG TPA: hypothetical protein ENJ18_10385 [Nannocystis exedens]|nr:hypothetical protein [Nannocystis exedens]
MSLGLLGLVACAGQRPPQSEPSTKELLVIDDNPHPTEVSDLAILRHRAVMGQHAEVRELIKDRLENASPSAVDPGRDALRRLLIQLALTEGDAVQAAAELTILDRDVERLGAAAGVESRAIVALLYSDLAYRGNYFLDARKWSLRAISLLAGSGSPLEGGALTALARSQLALNNQTQALEALSEATRNLETGRDVEYGDLHEALLLKVDVLLALRMADEAIIAAGEVYDGAIESYGSDSIPHAEALLAVAAASYAAGSADAARTLLGDASEIFKALQSAQPTSPFPVSERLLLRLVQMTEILASPSTAAVQMSAPTRILVLRPDVSFAGVWLCSNVGPVNTRSPAVGEDVGRDSCMLGLK